MSRRKKSGCLPGVIGLVVLAVIGYVVVADSSEPVPRPTVEPGGTSAQPTTTHPKAERSTTPKAQHPTSAQPKPPTTVSPVDPVSKLSFVDTAAAKRALPGLPVKGRAPLTGYRREAFGTAWVDVNGNGCDTRNDILRRDLENKVVQDCVVLSGVLHDPYSGDRVTFTRGPVTSLEVQIDHVVPLANAWQTGAKYWSDDKRERFANDRRNLLAVRGDLNLQKSDGDAATWLPPKKSFRCTYVSMQILTKQRYGLWVTAPEEAAMARILSSC
ncbi:MAG: DUF1524 domain-containing protein [Candidatus Nanopelagicales bacterium]